MGDAYLDACCFIYLIEGAPSWRAAVETALRTLPSSTGLVTSRLSRLECRSKPLGAGNHVLLARYDAVLAPPNALLLDITSAIVERATGLRARHGFRSPDAIHLATAIEARANVFLTGDATFSRCTDIRIQVLTP